MNSNLVDLWEFGEELWRYAPIKEANIFLDSCFIYTLWEWTMTTLDSPAQSNLCWRLVEFFSNFNQHWLLQDLPLYPCPRRTQRRICLKQKHFHVNIIQAESQKWVVLSVRVKCFLLIISNKSMSQLQQKEEEAHYTLFHHVWRPWT